MDGDLQGECQVVITPACAREHLAAGPLTIEQFDARLDRAAAAKTLGELEQVMADLPAGDPGQLPERFEPRMIAATPKGTPPARHIRISVDYGQRDDRRHATGGACSAEVRKRYRPALLAGDLPGTGGQPAAAVAVLIGNRQAVGRAITCRAGGYTFVVYTVMVRAAQRLLSAAQLTGIVAGLRS